MGPKMITYKLFLYAILSTVEISRGGETVDALALGASEATHGGSSPLPGTTI